MDDRSTDFTIVNGRVAYLGAKARECSLCGVKMGRLVAFLGGPRAAEGRTWTDPPMHPDCAEAAVTLCPHISKAGARRVADDQMNAQAAVTETMDLTKPDRWVMYATRNYRIELDRASTGGVIGCYRGQGARWTKTWTYGPDGLLAIRDDQR